MTRRLPVVDSDDGAWGDWLNNFLIKEHVDTAGVPAVTNGGHKTITVQAGSTAADSAPIKLTSGAPMTTPEAGAIEFQTDKLYFTQTTATTRKVVATYFDGAGGATGDIYYRDASGNYVPLTVGANNYVLASNGTIPGWVAPGPNFQQAMAISSMRI